MPAKTNEEIDAIMATIHPDSFRYTWCGAERGPCACMGCVQICSRAMMYEKFTGRKLQIDPEHINPYAFPVDIREACTITREEWEAWKVRHPETNPPQCSYGYSTHEPGGMA